MKAISKSLQETFVLAYHLKMLDYNNKHQTKIFDKVYLSDEFAGNIPEIVKKIIISNKVVSDGRLSPIEGARF